MSRGAVDYSRWDDLNEWEEKDEDSLHNLQLSLSSLHHKATELFERSDFAQATEAYQEILRYLSSTSLETMALMKEKAQQLFHSTFLNLIACLVKQDKFCQAVERCEEFKHFLEDRNALCQLSDCESFRFHYFQAHGYLGLSPFLHQHLAIVKDSLLAMETIASKKENADASWMSDITEIKQLCAHRQSLLQKQSGRYWREHLLDVLPVTINLIKQERWNDASRTILSELAQCAKDDHLDRAFLAEGQVLAARLLLSGRKDEDAWEVLNMAWEECDLSLCRTVSSIPLSASLQKPSVLIAMSAIVQLQWKCDREVNDKEDLYKRTWLLAGRLEEEVVHLLGQETCRLNVNQWTFSTATDTWGDMLKSWIKGLFDSPRGYLGEAVYHLLGLYDLLSAYCRDQSQWERCYDYLVLKDKEKPAEIASLLAVIKRIRAASLYSLGSVVMQVKDRVHDLDNKEYSNIFKSWLSSSRSFFYDEVEELLSHRVRDYPQYQLFSSKLFESAAGAALESSMPSLAARAGKQSGELLIDSYGITAFRVGKTKVLPERAEHCHDVWRLVANAYRKMVDNAERKNGDSDLLHSVKVSVIEHKVEVMLALYQAGLSAACGGLLELAQRALESAAEMRADVEDCDVTLSTDFSLASGDLSFHLSHVYLHLGHRQYLIDELRRADNYYARYRRSNTEGIDQDLTKQRILHLDVLKAWSALLEGKLDSVEEMIRNIESRRQGPSEDFSEDLMDLRKQLVLMQEERLRPTPLVSGGASNRKEGDREEENHPVQMSSKDRNGVGGRGLWQRWRAYWSRGEGLDLDLVIAYSIVESLTLKHVHSLTNIKHDVPSRGVNAEC
eukprot:scaffold2205_cov183-Ochromonas_danica.AAC.19